MLTGRPSDRRKFPRVATTGKVPGRVVVVATGAELDCRAIDVSQLGLGLEATEELPMNAVVMLEMAQATIKLRVVSQVKGEAGVRRYGLIVEGNEVDLEGEFRRAGCCVELDAAGRRLPPQGIAADRAPRYILDQALSVDVKTFGTSELYRLTIENLSRSGLLVVISANEHLPFRINTLLDLIIDPDRKAFQRAIIATGKIVRRIDDPAHPSEMDRGKPVVVRLGIAVVDMAKEHEAAWQAALDQLEKPA